jgi:mono/diheme cytochrome c family protein
MTRKALDRGSRLSRRVVQALPWLVLAAVIAVRAEDAPARPSLDLVSATVDDLAKQAYAILKANCFECHGAPKRSGLDMRTPDSLAAGGSKGKVIVAHEPEQSRLFLYAMQEGDVKMPPAPRAKLS